MTPRDHSLLRNYACGGDPVKGGPENAFQFKRMLEKATSLEGPTKIQLLIKSTGGQNNENPDGGQNNEQPKGKPKNKALECESLYNPHGFDVLAADYYMVCNGPSETIEKMKVRNTMKITGKAKDKLILPAEIGEKWKKVYALQKLEQKEGINT